MVHWFVEEGFVFDNRFNGFAVAGFDQLEEATQRAVKFLLIECTASQ
ncbi:hypothetical protein [Secundilactobacillus similis]|nr:hypothetical protein [Secundilactobacillus similis]